MNEYNFQLVLSFFSKLQNKICDTLIQVDNHSVFKKDIWSKKNCQGDTRILKNGKIFEKASVSTSDISGNSLPNTSTNKNKNFLNCLYRATGISVIVHPKNPYIPTSHLNLRFFLVYDSQNLLKWWFGGGFDLTPYYGFTEDVVHWHQTAEQICRPFGVDLYKKYKKWCDDYFFIKHRNEPRGIGGLFFDDVNKPNFHHVFSFTKSVGDGYIKAYLPIVNLRKSYTWSKRERDFQLYRRSRYVEFNLLLDRGTIFGIQSQGRIESILSSMPPIVKWKYNWKPRPKSQESKLYTDFLPVKNWINKN
ncbi:MAG: oxygen-dependent coproporphyrinogen oxidase [Wigglesworthia glossinidia]|nr:oxygen-dependent coproporphyrinogen oxidase [Wigglesworthia glossinidia]